MKSWLNSANRLTITVLVICTLVSLMLHSVQISFPCLNSDEAAFGYNAYSILKTGKDEYGMTLPSRFKSFGENKLPVLGYLTVPFIASFGLNETATRLPTTLVGIALPLLFYFVTKELLQRKSIALVAAILASFSPWLQILSRHAHEAVIAYACIIGAIWFTLRYQKNNSLLAFAGAVICTTVALFSHHIAKPFAVFFVLWIVVIVFQKKLALKKLIWPAVLLLIPLLLFAYTEVTQPTNRISNLVFYNNSGFQQSIDELRREHDLRLLHNKLTQGALELTHNYFQYFSYEFLVAKGDTGNPKFGWPGMSPITPVEFVFFWIGLFFLFHLKEKHRYVLVSLLLVAPLSAAFSWQEQSVT